MKPMGLVRVFPILDQQDLKRLLFLPKRTATPYAMHTRFDARGTQTQLVCNHKMDISKFQLQWSNFFASN